MNLIAGFFSAPFRPFFSLTLLSGIFFPMYLVTILINSYPYPGEILDPITWHGHEMLFGFFSALLLGTLLSLVPKWTDTVVIKGKTLLLLVCLWALARIVFFFQFSTVPMFVVAPLSLLALLFILIRKLKSGYPLLITSLLIQFLVIAEYLYLFDETRTWGLRLAVSCVASFIIIFSGRLMPFLTKSYPLQRQEKLDVALILQLTMAIMLDKSNLYLFTFFILFYRAHLSFHPKILKNFFELNVHLGLCWLLIFCGIKSLGAHYPSLLEGRADLHILFTGALTLFAVSIIGRMSQELSAIKLKATWVDIVAYVCIFLGAALRVFIPIIEQETFTPFLHQSMGLWSTGLIIFFIKYCPLYFKNSKGQ